MRLLRLLRKAKAERQAEVRRKLESFRKNRFQPAHRKFRELCFCILVANSGLGQTKGAWEKAGDGLLTLEAPELQAELKRHGCRFHNRAHDIVEARKNMDRLDEALSMHPHDAREWLRASIRGIGWKEASHFLRNMGCRNLAIIDRHVASVLKGHGVIRRIPNLSSRKGYLEVERKLAGLSGELGVDLAELDCYLFYLGSGRLPEK